jgi:hypothetical protein
MQLLALLAALLAGCSISSTRIEEKGAGAPSSEAEVGLDAAPAGLTGGVAALAAPEAASTDRLLVRTGDLALRTANPAEVGRRATEAVERAGGHVVKQVDLRYRFRIPEPRFLEVFSAIEAMGAVVRRQLETEDVADEVRDLELRLKNAMALRDRYAELLKKAEKVEDLLAIERELSKVTEEIERMEAQLLQRKREVAMALLTLTLVPVAGGSPSAFQSPFAWLGSIGVERLPQFRANRASSSRVRWQLPADFADMGRISDSDVQGWAYSPDGIRIVVRRFDHRPAASAAFWEKELLRALVHSRGYEREPARDRPGALAFRTLTDGVPITYAVRLVVKERHLTVVELFGPSEALDRQWAHLSTVLDKIELDAR